MRLYKNIIIASVIDSDGDFGGSEFREHPDLHTELLTMYKQDKSARLHILNNIHGLTGIIFKCKVKEYRNIPVEFLDFIQDEFLDYESQEHKGFFILESEIVDVDELACYCKI